MANEKTYKFHFVDTDRAKQVNVMQQVLFQQGIDVYGVDTWYMPLETYTKVELDNIFQEVNNKDYNNLYGMRMYPEDALTMAGQGDL